MQDISAPSNARVPASGQSLPQDSPKTSISSNGNALSSVRTQSKLVEKVPTGIWGFDEIAHGGIPKGRTTLLSGTSGSGKTIFAVQFLVMGILKYRENGVFVTFEESPSDIIKNMLGFNWDLQKYIDDGMLAFVDASPSEDDTIEVGGFDLGAFLIRLLHVINKISAKRVAVDSISALFPRYSDQSLIRRELFRISSRLKKVGVTTIITGERLGEQDAGAGRFGVEEFVSDNVIILHNNFDETLGDRKRSIEILKFRGTRYETQETPFLVQYSGIVVLPRPKFRYEHYKIPKIKLATGVAGLDEMFDGGVYAGSSTLISGPSGVGKTLMSIRFLIEGAERGELGVMFAFGESSEQLYRTAENFGWNLREYVYKGQIRLYTTAPERLKPEEHYKHIQDVVGAVDAKRFVLDSLAHLRRIFSTNSFNEFTIGLCVYLRSKALTSFIADNKSSIGESTDALSTYYLSIMDNIILIRYFEYQGAMNKVLGLIKARGINHDKRLRQVIVDSSGIRIGDPFDGGGA